MTGVVLSRGEMSDSFVICNDVRQGCVFTLVLFYLFFTCVLTNAVRDLDHGVYLRYGHDGPLFGLRHLRVKTKTLERMILEALYGNDCALMAHKGSDLHVILEKFAEISHLFGLTISLGKTELLLHPSPGSIAFHVQLLLRVQC